MGITVNNRDEVCVTSGASILIYNSQGRGIAVSGGKGGAPGEYNQPRNPVYGPTDYLTVLDTHFDAPYTVYSPDNSLLFRKEFRTSSGRERLIERHNLLALNLVRIVSIGPDERCVEGEAIRENQKGERERAGLLYYESPDTLLTLALYPVMNVVSQGGMQKVVPEFGEFSWKVTKSNAIVYTHSGYDTTHSDGDYNYRIHLYSPKEGARTPIDRQYDPVPFDIPPVSMQEHSDTRIQEFERAVAEASRRAQFQAPVRKIYADINRIYVLTSMRGASGGYQVDVFQEPGGAYAGSVQFPFEPSVIKNGCVYRIVNIIGEPPAIEKYELEIW
jgi:hypothetical protein